MKKPENFRKIDGVTFATRTGTKYKFSTSYLYSLPINEI